MGEKRYKYNKTKKTKRKKIKAVIALCLVATIFGPVVATDIGFKNYNGEIQIEESELRESPDEKEKFIKYDDFVERIAREIQELNLPDDFSKILAIRTKLVENNYAYGSAGAEASKLGLAIVDGRGVCRDLAFFEKAVATQLGLKAEVIGCYLPSLASFKKSEISKQYGRAESEGNEFSFGVLKFLPSVLFLPKLYGNHTIVLYDKVSCQINDDGNISIKIIEKLYSDSTNPSFLVRKKGANKLYNLNGPIKDTFCYRISPIGENLMDMVEHGETKSVLKKMKDISAGDNFYGAYTEKEAKQLASLIGVDNQNAIEQSIQKQIGMLP